MDSLVSGQVALRKEPSGVTLREITPEGPIALVCADVNLKVTLL
jgi:hypothetical protein